MNKFSLSNLKIGHKLLLGFTFVVLVTGVIGERSVHYLNSISKLTVDMYNHPLTVSNAVRDIKANINAMHRSMMYVAMSESLAEINNAAQIVDDLEQEVLQEFGIVFDRFLGDMSDVEKANKSFSDWKVIRDEVIELSKGGSKQEAIKITRGKGAEHVIFMTNNIQAMVDYASNKADTFLADALEQKQQTIYIMLGLIIILVCISVFVAYRITHSIVKPLELIVSGIRNISIGSLSHTLNIVRKDEIGVLANSYTELQNYLKQKVLLAEKIASGDFSSDIPPRSDEDELGSAFFAMTTSLRETTGSLKKSEEERTLLNQLVYGSLASANVGAYWIDFTEEDTFHGLDTTVKLIGIEPNMSGDSYKLSDWETKLQETKKSDPGYSKIIGEVFEKIEELKLGKIDYYRVVYPVKKNDGSIIWIDDRADVTKRDETGIALFMTGTLIDITDVKKNEDFLARQKKEAELLHKVSEISSDSESTLR